MQPLKPQATNVFKHRLLGRMWTCFRNQFQWEREKKYPKMSWEHAARLRRQRCIWIMRCAFHKIIYSICRCFPISMQVFASVDCRWNRVCRQWIHTKMNTTGQSARIATQKESKLKTRPTEGVLESKVWHREAAAVWHNSVAVIDTKECPLRNVFIILRSRPVFILETFLANAVNAKSCVRKTSKTISRRDVEIMCQPHHVYQKCLQLNCV